jgi:hypothetical protein
MPKAMKLVTVKPDRNRWGEGWLKYIRHRFDNTPSLPYFGNMFVG